jgi:hypothetical protein
MDFYENMISDNDFDLIDNQNSKSKEILLQYEKNAIEREKNKLTKMNDLKNELMNDEKKLKHYEELEEFDAYENNELDENNNFFKKFKDLKNGIKDIKCEINKTNKINKYPHGNGIFGFALEYLQAAKEINIKWIEHIYTWTIIGYKKVYPINATQYLEYEEDIKTSSHIMNQIYHKLSIEKINRYQIFFSRWIDIINEYLKENNITINDNVVFRPHYHNDMIMEEDYEQVEYYRITKEDLCSVDEDYEDSEEYEDNFLSMLKSLSP